MRTLSLLLNFSTGVNLNFQEIHRLQHTSLLGETVSVAEGTRNPWMLVGQLSLLLLLILVIQASLANWRRGQRQRALVVGGSMMFFIIVGIGHTVLVLWGLLPRPLLGTFPFLCLVVAMGFKMSGDIVRSAQLRQDLRGIEVQLALAADAASLGVWTHDRWRFILACS